MIGEVHCADEYRCSSATRTRRGSQLVFSLVPRTEDWHYPRYVAWCDRDHAVNAFLPDSVVADEALRQQLSCSEPCVVLY